MSWSQFYPPLDNENSFSGDGGFNCYWIGVCIDVTYQSKGRVLQQNPLKSTGEEEVGTQRLKQSKAALLLSLPSAAKETKQELRRVKVRMGMAPPKVKSVNNPR